MKQRKEKKETVHTETKWKQVYNRCIARSQKPLSQLRTQSSQGVHSVHYAASYTINPVELERAGLSFLPIAKSGHCSERWRAAGKDWESMYGVSDWKPESWRCSYGIQIFTGSPSGDITDLDFEFAMIRDHSDVFIETLQQLCALVDNPLLVITKRGGLRFSVRTPGYMHPIREKIAVATWKNYREHDKLYLEIFGEKGLSRYDARYEIVSGSLLNIPVVDYRPVLEIVDALRKQIGTPKPKKPISTKPTTLGQQRDDVSSVEFVDALPSDLRWVERSDGSLLSLRSDYPCQVTEHTKSAGSAQYYKQLNGQIDAFCHNCQQSWIVKKSDRTTRINEIRAGRLSPLAVQRKTVKLIKDERANAILDALEKAGERIAAFFRSTTRVLAFRADTGTGKNYEAETYAINEGAVLVNVPTGDLAIDLEKRMHGRLSEAGLPRDQVFRRRGLMHRWNKGEDAHHRFPHEIPCIQAARCDAYRKKGGNMYEIICSSCPVQVECLQHGYRSQPEHAKNARMVITTHPDFHLNLAHKGFAKPYLTDCTGEPRLVVQDDVSTHALFLECQITRNRLQQMRDAWDGTFLSSFAKKLLHLLDVEGTPYAIGDYLDTLTQEQKGLLNYQLTRVRIQTTQADGTITHSVMTLDEAVANGFFGDASETEIAQMPAVYPKHWTLFDQLQSFFEHYKRAEDAPIQYHDGTLTFTIPPCLHKDVWKAVFMSATLDTCLFKRVFPKAHTKSLPPTQWKLGTKVYQLRTNRNPRATVYNRADGEVVGLSDTGENYWQLMINEIARTPDTQHAIITYKDVLKWKRDDEASDLTGLHNITATAHYGNLVGLDTEFRGADTLWVLFTPEIPDYEITWRAKMFFGDDPEPLNYERDTETGMYRDSRLQQVWENAVVGELIQAIGRARLVRKARTVIIFTSHHIPGITDRSETKLFDEADWDIAGGIDGLDNAIAKREEFEARAAALTAENTIADFQEVHGCSYERARQLWHEAGGSEAKNERDIKLYKQIQALKAEKISDSEIAKSLDISRGKLQSLLRKYGAA